MQRKEKFYTFMVRLHISTAIMANSMEGSWILIIGPLLIQQSTDIITKDNLYSCVYRSTIHYSWNMEST